MRFFFAFKNKIQLQAKETVRELFDLYEAHYSTLKVAQGFSANGLMSLRSVLLEIGDEDAATLDSCAAAGDPSAAQRASPTPKRVTRKIFVFIPRWSLG